MRHMNFQSLVVFGLAVCAITFCGCDSKKRREALGGGALSPVKVTLLREAKAGSDGGANVQSAGPKITEFGTVKGRITVAGKLATLPNLSISGPDLVCGEKPIPNQTVVGEKGGLGNVFIYLKKVPNVDVPSASESQVVVDQQGCFFIPHAQVAQVGQPVLLKNTDPVAHNVNIKGRANSFNSTVSPNNAGNVDYKFQFSEQKPALVICDFHGWMAAYMLPVNHPWAVVTNPDGTFEIPNVPAGEMEFVIWHEKLDYIERAYKVSVPANGEASPVDISVAADKLAG